MRKHWFDLKAKAEQPAEISIYDDIGAYGVSAKDFIAALNGITAPAIHLSINSPGGSVFDALAMFNALRQHPAEILVDIMGVAASAASLVAMAGDKIMMPDNAFMMIHNPWSVATGNAAELRDLADTMDKIGESLVTIYSNRSGQPADKIRQLLDAETWLSAQEALDLGLADEISPTLPISARFDLDRMPAAVQAVWGKAPPASITSDLDPVAITGKIKAIEAALIGFAKTKGLELSAKVPLEPTEYVINAAAICEAARMPELTDTVIESKVPLSVLRQMIQNFRVSSDLAGDTNNRLPQPGVGTPASQIWSQRRGQP